MSVSAASGCVRNNSSLLLQKIP